MRPTRAIVTVCGVGFLPGAPGSWAALLAIPLANLLHVALGFPGFAAVTLVATLLGWWATVEETRGQDNTDPHFIVIDEVVGMWIALFPISAGLWWMGSDLMVFPWPAWVGGFLLFRFFDILKPPPVSWADRMHTPFGVMFDDVLAGLLSALITLLGAAVAHGWF
ncbi:phosphatidylglycerophosphatase A [Paroceanicella profunda]|uniref:Phosphatidylglycerophosphatase A n=1 Tax=Paroceanicella profunda TaxID=2579971 RepID=A0A5B8FVP9_9RHOB|nr:phosphatidylglycerophosphatase A [Paroceanicella profunda]QDL92896.1 phosphatidylglycerophosphatase A [Paroceanicella profunda]